MDSLIQWAAPILSTLIICAGQLALNQRVKLSDERRAQEQRRTDEKRRAEAEWRQSVDARLDAQDSKIDAVLKGQTTQMRSDLIHRAHRYIDDLNCASVDEKKAFWDEYVDYCAICEAYEIKNSFVDNIAQQVMQLPDRPQK